MNAFWWFLLSYYRRRLHGFSHCYYLPTRRYSLLSTIGMFAVCTKYRSGRILLHSWIRAHKQRGRKYNGWIFPVFAGFGKKKNQHLMFNSESLKVIENDSLCKINLFREVSIHVYVFNLDKTINVIFMQMEQEYSGLNLLPFKILKFKASRLVSLCWWRKLQSSLCTHVKLLSHHASVCRIQLYCKDT